MADTQIVGAGVICSVSGSVVTPSAPLNFDGGETFLIDVTLGTSFPIVSTVKDSNNLVTSITVTGSPTSGNGFCQALSAASASNIFTTVGSANAAASSNDIVMYTPALRAQSITNSALNLPLVINVTYRSASPVWKLYATAHSGAGPFSLTLANLVNVEDMIIDGGRDPVTAASGGGTSTLRRCIIQVSELTSNGSGTLINIENCLIHCLRGNGGIRSLTSSNIQVKHCFILRTRLIPDGTSAMSMDNTILVEETSSLIPSALLTGDFNWSTEVITLPGAGSITGKDLDDLKIALSETEVGGFPTGPMYGWLPTPAASFGFTGSPPTVLGATDAERRDFYGNLRPTTGNQTCGPINLETHDSGVAWSTYATAELIAPNAPVITSVVAGDGQITINLTGDAGKVHEVFFFTPGSTTPVSGGIRTGDGAIVISGLSNGVTIVIIALTRASPTYGPPSLCVSATPATTGATATSPVAAYCVSMRDFYLNNANFLAWINTVNASETTSGHVRLGWRPQDGTDLKAKGPIALIRWENFRMDNAGGPKTFSATVDIVVDHIWQSVNALRASDDFVEEMSFIDKIIDDAVDIGLNFDTTGTNFGGHLETIASPNSLEQDPSDPNVWHCEVSYTVRFGHDG